VPYSSEGTLDNSLLWSRSGSGKAEEAASRCTLIVGAGVFLGCSTFTLSRACVPVPLKLSWERAVFSSRGWHRRHRRHRRHYDCSAGSTLSRDELQKRVPVGSRGRVVTPSHDLVQKSPRFPEIGTNPHDEWKSEPRFW